MNLVWNWKEARHWYSVHFSLYGALFNGAFAAIVKGSSIAVALVGVLPLSYVFIAGAVLSIMAGLGRVVHQKVPNPPITTVPKAP